MDRKEFVQRYAIARNCASGKNISCIVESAYKFYNSIEQYEESLSKKPETTSSGTMKCPQCSNGIRYDVTGGTTSVACDYCKGTGKVLK